MSIYKSVFTPSFEVEEPEKGILLDNLAATLSDLNKALGALPDAASKASSGRLLKNCGMNSKSKPLIKSYLRGTKPCCIQLEILYEIEDNDDNLKLECIDEGCNIADYYLQLIKDYVSYSTLPDNALLLVDKSNKSNVVMQADGKEVVLKTEAVNLKQVKSFENKITKLLKVIDNTPEIVSFSLGNANDGEEPLTISKSSIHNAVEPFVVKKENSQRQEYLDVTVLVISPYLYELQKKWTIMFNPQLPEGLISSSKHEYRATVIDKDYLASLNKEKFGMGDKLKCDISYTVRWMEGRDLAKITDIVISRVKGHV